MLVAAGFLAVALGVIALIVFSGGNNEDPGLAAATPSTDGTTGLADAIETATSSGAASTVQPAPTATTPVLTPTGTSAAVTPTATAGSSEPTATTEIDPVDDPTPTVEPEIVEPEPTEPPVIGDFGELPPPQIVSGGLTRPLNLEYELAVSLDEAPPSAPVYLMEWPTWTAEDVAEIASNLGVNGEVEGDAGDFQVIGDEGELYVSGPTIQYVYTGTMSTDGLGDNSTLIQTARSWIYDNGLMSDDVNGGAVIGRDDDAARAVILFKPANPSPLLAFFPSATVTLGPGGSVVEANIRWPSTYIGSDYGLRSGDELWNDVLAGEASFEADLSEVGGSGPLSGTLTIYSISIAYSYAGDSASGEFLVPLVVFSGEAALNESDAIVPVSIYVPAVYGQAAPRG